MERQPLKQFRVKPDARMDFPDDIARIKRVLEDHGYAGTEEQCAQLWELYSDSYCAGWLMLPEDDESVFNAVWLYMVEPTDITQ